MKKFIFQRIGTAAVLALFFLNPANAFENATHKKRVDTLKSLAINRTLLARFESEYNALSRSDRLSISDQTKHNLTNIQYKIKALDEENEKLMTALPETLQANEFLKNIVAKSASEKINTTMESQFAIEEVPRLQTPSPAFQVSASSKRNRITGMQEKTVEETLKLHERALEFVAKKEIKKAIKLYEEIVLTDPNDDEAYLIMGHCLVLTGEFGKAEEAFQNAARINSRSLSQILPFYENLIRQNPDEADAYANLGFVCLMFGNTKRAQESFKQALSLNPNNRTALKGLGTIESN